MTNEASKLNEIGQQIITLGPEALVIAGLIVIGYFLKVTPVIDNRFIPGILLIVSVLAYPAFIASEGDGSASLIRNFFIALVLWFVAWVLHMVVLRRIENWLGVFQTPGRVAKKAAKQAKQEDHTDADQS